ncbi:MAG: pilus assembly protein PilX [Eubacterium sp.]|nr:pilus assembly protein PilX [Eubacterium sp.]
MRKINAVLSALLLCIFLIHGVMGSFMLLGVGSSAGKILAWIGVLILIAHTVIGVLLTVQTLRTEKKNGEHYLRQNAVFWARRASGLAVLVLFFFHLGLFGRLQDGIYILFPFTTVKLITQLLLTAALFVHLFINVRPLLVSLGILKYKERRGDIYLILSVLLLFFAGATIIYYIGWQQI